MLLSYATDRLGSVTALLNTAGNLENTYRYDPWGGTVGSSGGRTNPYQYTGAYRDIQDIYQMGARYYKSGAGRFTQQDPLPISVFEATR